MQTRTQLGYCRSCNARIVWSRTSANKAMPLDFNSVSEQGRQRAAAGDPLAYSAAAGHVSHFASCPNAPQHRNRKGA